MDRLRECQRNALLEFEKHYYFDEETRGIMSMCCGSGKTRTIYEMIKLSYTKSKQNNLLFVLATSRTNLIYQIGEDFEKMIKMEKLPFKYRFVGGSGEKFSKKTLTGLQLVAFFSFFFIFLYIYNTSINFFYLLILFSNSYSVYLSFYLILLLLFLLIVNC